MIFVYYVAHTCTFNSVQVTYGIEKWSGKKRVWGHWTSLWANDASYVSLFSLFAFVSVFSCSVKERRPPHAPNWQNVSHGSHHCERRMVCGNGNPIAGDSFDLKLTCGVAPLASPRVCQAARLFCSLAFSGWKTTRPRPAFFPCRPVALVRVSIWNFQ